MEYTGCDPAVLNDIEAVQSALERAAEASHSTVVASVFHPFVPQGVTGVVVIEESHLAVHTWPESGYAAVDFYTCGNGDPLAAHAVIRDALGAQQSEIMMVERGRSPGAEADNRGIEVQSHATETGPRTGPDR